MFIFGFFQVTQPNQEAGKAPMEKDRPTAVQRQEATPTVAKSDSPGSPSSVNPKFAAPSKSIKETPLYKSGKSELFLSPILGEL